MEMQITATRRARIQKTVSDRCWQGWGDAGTLLHTGWEWKMGQLLWKQSGSFKQLSMELPRDPQFHSRYLPRGK